MLFGQFCLAMVVCFILDFTPGAWFPGVHGENSLADTFSKIEKRPVKHIGIWVAVSVAWILFIEACYLWG